MHRSRFTPVIFSKNLVAPLQQRRSPHSPRQRSHLWSSSKTTPRRLFLSSRANKYTTNFINVFYTAKMSFSWFYAAIIGCCICFNHAHQITIERNKNFCKDPHNSVTYLFANFFPTLARPSQPNCCCCLKILHFLCCFQCQKMSSPSKLVHQQGLPKAVKFVNGCVALLELSCSSPF